MDYIIVGLLFGMGLYLARLIFGIIEELLFSRLHKAEWYNIIAGKQPKGIKGTMDVKTVKNKIGF